MVGFFSTSQGIIIWTWWCSSENSVYRSRGNCSLGTLECYRTILYLLKKFNGLRVEKRIEEEGLDIYEHGESAYNI